MQTTTDIGNPTMIDDPRLNRVLELIKRVGGFDDDLKYLYRCSIKEKSWWMKPLNKTTTYSETCIRLWKNFYKAPLQTQAGTLCHESIHCKQYRYGRLTWIKYLNPFDSRLRTVVEMEGEAEEQRFHMFYKEWKSKNPVEAKLFT